MTEASPNRSVMIVLAYLWPLALVPLLIEREDAEVQWHARHGLVLMAVEAAAAAALAVALPLARFAAFGLGSALLAATVAAWSAVCAVHIAAIIRGLNGDRLIVPGISGRVR